MSGYAYLFLITAALLCPLIILYNYRKPAPIQPRTSYVKVVLKGTRRRKHHRPGILRREENVFFVLVQMKNGVIREFEMCEQEYCTLEEGMTGLLIWSEKRYIRFESF